jgi:transcriptional regulator with XRE-family HTH domain
MNRRLTLPKSAKAHSELAIFLRFLRRRIDPDAHVLGPYVRLSQRLGKGVTQEELAEAIGVRREWYSKLESAETTRPSTGLVDRLADALMVTSQERVRLFHLAVPELGRAQLRDDSIAPLQGLSRLRSLTKRLWAATSLEDVLTTASEQIADQFDGALLVRSTRRCESGLWEHRSVDDRQDRNNAAKVIRDVKDLRPTPEFHSALNYHGQLTNAGDIGSADLWPLALQREILEVYARHRVAGFVGVYARVRSRTGFTGGLYIVNELGHSYSASDRAVLGAFAELTSFALS